jgi:hypothetical protein
MVLGMEVAVIVPSVAAGRSLDLPAGWTAVAFNEATYASRYEVIVVPEYTMRLMREIPKAWLWWESAMLCRLGPGGKVVEV